LLGPSIEFQKVRAKPDDVASLFRGDLTPKTWPTAGEPYLGRIRPLIADCRLFKKWKEYCTIAHRDICGLRPERSMPASLRLIDVERESLIHCGEQAQWAVLSYMWGDEDVFTLRSNIVDQCSQAGGLSEDVVPSTIYDAMKVTAALGLKYLWVDSLCIIQDDPTDKQRYISHMDAIFGNSELVIIDSAGTNPHCGLPGIRPFSRNQIQDPFEIGEVTLMQVLDPINVFGSGYVGESKWNSRGWTFQEALLPTRALIFAPEQVYWQCSQASWCEDGSWECSEEPIIYRHSLTDEFRSLWSSDSFSAEQKYRRLVEAYSQRTLRYESDGLAAFQGILAALKRISGLEFHWGLPLEYLGAALTWPTQDETFEVKRRTVLCEYQDSRGVSIKCPFPSWSWVGWTGKVFFDEIFGVLTSRHAGLTFYTVDSERNVHKVKQNVKFREKYDGHTTMGLGFSNRKAPAEPRPLWRDVARTEIAKDDVPSAIFQSNLWAIALGFWTSTAVLSLEYHKGEKYGKAHELFRNRTKLSVMWQHPPNEKNWKASEEVQAIIVGRDTLCHLRRKEQLVAIITDLDDGSGVFQRRAMASIDESDWNALDNRIWRKVFLI
jgi:hypothetical protein